MSRNYQKRGGGVKNLFAVRAAGAIFFLVSQLVQFYGRAEGAVFREGSRSNRKGACAIFATPEDNPFIRDRRRKTFLEISCFCPPPPISKCLAGYVIVESVT